MSDYIIIPFNEIADVYLQNKIKRRWKRGYTEMIVKNIVMQSFITDEDILECGLADLYLFLITKAGWTNFRLYICKDLVTNKARYFYMLINMNKKNND